MEKPTIKPGNRGSDEAFYQLVKDAGEAILKLVGVAPGLGYHIHAEELKAKRVSPDIVAIPSIVGDDIVIMEFQGYSDPFIRHRVAAAVAFYCSQEKKAPPILPAIIFTERSFLNTALPLDISDSTGQYQLRGRFKEIVLEDYTETQLLALDPRLVVLVPYTLPANMGKDELGLKMRDWVELVRELYPPEQSHAQIDLLALISLNRFRHLTIEEVVAMLNFDLTDTTAGQQLIDIGIQKGIQKGIRQGIRQGILQKAREDILEILEVRFGRVPQEVTDVTNELTDLSRLNVLLKRAALVGGIDEFVEGLGQPKLTN
ncbi:MAG: DUF2887 domain-containing protein [Deltaproteobacteria bacterium]|nr:DUF2887 domain-containing protein [Deltaproteobacteria bacterium]